MGQEQGQGQENINKPVGERLAAIEAHAEHSAGNITEIKTTMGKLFDLSDRTLKAIGELNTANKLQDQEIEDHVCNVFLHHTSPCEAAKALGAVGASEHIGDASLHHEPPCEFAKTTSNRGWALLIVVIGAVVTALSAWAIASFG